MKIFFNLLIFIIKLLISIKVSYLLYITYNNPTNAIIDKLSWWICLLVFDVWLMSNLPQPKEDES
jgi:hypothetical protein